MEVKIDLRRSLPENASFYYERAKKAKGKIAGAEKAIKETLEKIGKLSGEAPPAERRVVLKERKAKKWFEKFRWFESSDGFLVLGGRDATSNEVLVKKHLEANDLVFHADFHGAPFFIVKNADGRDIPDATKREAAEAAGSYSRAWAGGSGSCDIYYVNPEQVSKTPPAGEYLTKGAFMIYGRKNYIRGVELKIAVGFIVGESVEVIGGPVSAISKRTRHYAVLGVGDMKSGELARRIKAAVMGKAGKEDAEKLKSVGLGGIQYWIPGGKGRLL